MNGVATTALLVAALRAREQARPDRLFDDPFADALAGPEGHAALDSYRAAAGPGVPIIEVRTRYYDEALARATDAGLRQVVLLAAGMDARAYRIAWPAGTRLFELDQPEMLAAKAAVLAHATPRCERHAIPADLRADWPSALAGAGFDRALPTAWMIEGLLQYLPPDAARAVCSHVDRLSAPGSRAHFDVLGNAMLTSPMLQPALAWMAGIGAPWIFGTDDPGSLFPGWSTAATDSAALGNALGRWPFPAAPADVPGVPRGYLVYSMRA